MKNEKKYIPFKITCMKQSWKCILTRAAARVGSLSKALLTTFLTTGSTKGQLIK
jgi:hypothetical protein